MKFIAALVTTASLLAFSACGESKVETEKPDKSANVSISIDGNETEDGVQIAGDSDTGKLEIRLPGGLEAKVDMPEGVGEKAKFDIDGVGLYPGAKVGSIKVDVAKRKAEAGRTHDATVDIGFSAPADAAAVADWYQQQFEARRIAVTRSGDTLAGKTDDGDDFTLALTPAAGGAAGRLTIREAS